MYGTEQGSGASPLVWLSIVVCVLVTLTVLASIAMLFLDPWGDIVKEHNADSFVDDTSLGCNHDAHLETAMPFPQLIAKGQECAQAWDLYSSSSALELQKCFGILFTGNGLAAACRGLQP